MRKCCMNKKGFSDILTMRSDHHILVKQAKNSVCLHMQISLSYLSKQICIDCNCHSPWPGKSCDLDYCTVSTSFLDPISFTRVQCTLLCQISTCWHVPHWQCCSASQIASTHIWCCTRPSRCLHLIVHCSSSPATVSVSLGTTPTHPVVCSTWWVSLNLAFVLLCLSVITSFLYFQLCLPLVLLILFSTHNSFPLCCSLLG